MLAAEYVPSTSSTAGVLLYERVVSSTEYYFVRLYLVYAGG